MQGKQMDDEPAVTAWRMQLSPGEAEAYRKRHDEIWPELSRELLAAGVIDFRIYLDPDTHMLFAHLAAEPSSSLDAMRDKSVMWRWWEMMADIMDTNPDHSPREWPLIPMFRLSRAG
jgi:L-rhamnose mutarotase